MAKPLFDRIQAALAPHARAPDVEALIATIDADIAGVEGEIVAQHAIATSAASDDATAEAAADAETKARRRLTRLRGQHAELQARHIEILNSDRRKAEEARRLEVLAERDDLVRDLRSRWTPLVDELTSLLQRVVDSDARTARYGEPSAEAIARGCSANFNDGPGLPVARLLDAKLATFDPTHRVDCMAWPKDGRTASGWDFVRYG